MKRIVNWQQYEMAMRLLSDCSLLASRHRQEASFILELVPVAEILAAIKAFEEREQRFEPHEQSAAPNQP